MERKKTLFILHSLPLPQYEITGKWSHSAVTKLLGVGLQRIKESTFWDTFV